MMSEYILPNTMNGQLIVEIAWGADLTGSPGSWTWTEVTNRALIKDGIDITLGRANESQEANPALLQLKFLNEDGYFSLGGLSPNYPYVNKGTPIRVRLNPGQGWMGGFIVIFQGEISGIKPDWMTIAGQIPTVAIEASGIMRRLGQFSDSIGGAIFRFTTMQTEPVYYWPLENEKGSYAPESLFTPKSYAFSQVYVNPDDNKVYGKVDWAADSDHPTGVSTPKISEGATLVFFPEPRYISWNKWAITWSEKNVAEGHTFFILGEGGGDAPYILADMGQEFPDTPSNYVRFYFVEGASDTLMFEYDMGEPYLWQNIWKQFAITMEDIGSSQLRWTLRYDGTQVDTYTSSYAYRMRPTSVTFASDFEGDGIGLSNFTIYNDSNWPDWDDQITAFYAHYGETTKERLVRLCAEQNIPLAASGSTDVYMGPQAPLSFMELLRECERTEQGLLLDGLSAGLTFYTRLDRENTISTFAELDGTDLVAPFEPLVDDSGVVNRATASTTLEEKNFYTLTDDAMGVDAIGPHDGSIQVNPIIESRIIDYAGWLVYQGTRNNFRTPSLTFRMEATPSISPTIFNIGVTERIQINDIEDALAQFPPNQIRLVVEGIQYQISSHSLSVKFNTTPNDRMLVATLASTTGDTDNDVMRLGPDSAILGSAVSAGATQISIDTVSGPIWTLAADDFPIVLSVGGIRVVATSSMDPTDPQTFNVSAVPVDLPAGATIDIWEYPVLSF